MGRIPTSQISRVSQWGQMRKHKCTCVIESLVVKINLVSPYMVLHVLITCLWHTKPQAFFVLMQKCMCVGTLHIFAFCVSLCLATNYTDNVSVDHEHKHFAVTISFRT